MRYLAKIMTRPKPSTGEMGVQIPSLTGDEIRKVLPMKQFLGIVEPYKIGDIIVVEQVEGTWYYTNKPYALGEWDMKAPANSYSYVTPYGYIAFTPSSIEIRHVNGGRIVVGATAQFSDTASMSSPTKWG